MLFYIMLFVLPTLCFVPFVFYSARYVFEIGVTAFDDGFDSMIFSVFLAGVATLVFLLAPISAWQGHARDLSDVNYQQHRIDVYEARVERLRETLNTAAVPAKPGISFDADSPWATIYTALTDAERELAQAHDARAQAILSIEARRNGPMSGVITFVGDYREDV